MFHPCSQSLLAISLVIGTAWSVSAQPRFVESVEVSLRELRVIVTDRKGTPVTSLEAHDFEVLEDDVPRTVTHFEAPLPPRPTVQNESALQRPRTPRRVVFFVDELSLHPHSRTKFLSRANTLVKEVLQEGGAVAVFTPAGQEKVLLDFSNDFEVVAGALKRVMEASSYRVNTQIAAELRYLERELSQASSKEEVKQIKRSYAGMGRARVTQRLGYLRAAVSTLGRSDGHKVLVLITNALAAQPGRESLVDLTSLDELPLLPSDLMPEIQTIGRIAAAQGVILYPMQPDTPSDLLISIDVLPRRARRALPASMFSATLRETERTLSSLAEHTGGRWFRGDGGISAAFEQIETDAQAQYLLAYRSTVTHERPRRIVVRVKNRPDLRVRTRREVLDRNVTAEAEDATVASLILYQLLDAQPINELQMIVAKGSPVAGNRGYTVPVKVRIPMRKFTFIPQSDGSYLARLAMNFAAAGARSTFVVIQERSHEIRITSEEYAALKDKLFEYSSELIVAHGRTAIAIGVLDVQGRQTSIHRMEVEAE